MIVLVSAVVVSGCAGPEDDGSRVEISETSNRITMTGTDEVINVSFEEDSLVVEGQVVTFSHGRVPLVSDYSLEKGVLSVVVGTVEGEGPKGATEHEASTYRLEVEKARNISRLVITHDTNGEETVLNRSINRGTQVENQSSR